MPGPNVEGKPFCVLSHQSGNLLSTLVTTRKTIIACIVTLTLSESRWGTENKLNTEK